jgi:hypothetical protein
VVVLLTSDVPFGRDGTIRGIRNVCVAVHDRCAPPGC